MPEGRSDEAQVPTGIAGTRRYGETTHSATPPSQLTATGTMRAGRGTPAFPREAVVRMAFEHTCDLDEQGCLSTGSADSCSAPRKKNCNPSVALLGNSTSPAWDFPRFRISRNQKSRGSRSLRTLKPLRIAAPPPLGY